MSDEFLTGVFRDKPAWHELGITKEGGWPNATQAFSEAGLMFEYRAHPVFVPVTKPDGETIELGTGKFALVRDPVPTIPDSGYEVIDLVSEHYKIVQNRELAEILDPLSEQWPVDTAGALGNGDRVFTVLSMGNRLIDGLGSDNKYKEEYKNFLFVGNDHKANGSIWWVYTTIRVVCNNTWLMALQEGIVGANIGHRGDPNLKLKFQAELQQAILKSEAEAISLFQQASKKKMEQDDHNKFLELVFPEPTVPNIMTKIEFAKASGMKGEVFDRMNEKAEAVRKQHEANVERAIEKRVNSAVLLEKFNDEYPKVANTLYAVAQASNELVNHGKGRNDDNPAARGMDVMFGSRKAELMQINTVMADFLK